MPFSTGLGDRNHDELVLLAPAGTLIPRSFTRRCFDRDRHARWLSQAQRVRGAIYLSDGALLASQIMADGRHVQPTDDDSWHLLALDGNGEVQGCARYRHLTGDVSFSDLGLRESSLASCDRWGNSFRSAVETEIALAKQRGTAFSEVGGWAIVPEKRCHGEALRIAMATYSLAQLLGGCVGIGAATERHGSASILRRIGGSSLEHGGKELPPYYDPQYRCRMEVLRFDSNAPESSCRKRVAQLSKRLLNVAVVVAEEPAWRPAAPPAVPQSLPGMWPSLPQLEWAT